MLPTERPSIVKVPVKVPSVSGALALQGGPPSQSGFTPTIAPLAASRLTPPAAPPGVLRAAGLAGPCSQAQPSTASNNADEMSAVLTFMSAPLLVDE